MSSPPSSASPPAPPAIRTWARPTSRCSTTSSPGTPAGASSCASRTPTATRYDAGHRRRRSSRACAGSACDYDEGPDVGGPNGPYRQSERTEIYRRRTWTCCWRTGKAYRCFCTAERLAEMRDGPARAQGTRRATTASAAASCRRGGRERLGRRALPFVVRLKVPKDGARSSSATRCAAPSSIEGRTIDDQVLMKSDGFPTYHLANVVDDHLMEVTDVIRAEEWITSTPKHVLLYEAFGWEPPRFCHMPLLRNTDQSKISKRKNPTSLVWYKENGYLPEALVNFLALMGYSHPDGEEVFSLAEMLETFDPQRITHEQPGLRPGEAAVAERRVHPRGRCGEADGSPSRALDLSRARGTALRPRDGRPLLAWLNAHGGFGAEAVAAVRARHDARSCSAHQDAWRSTRRWRAASSWSDVSGYDRGPGPEEADRGRGAQRPGTGRRGSRPSTSGRRRPSRPTCAPWARSWAGSPATSSSPCGSRSRARRSARRCSRPWRCWAGRPLARIAVARRARASSRSGSVGRSLRNQPSFSTSTRPPLSVFASVPLTATRSSSRRPKSSVSTSLPVASRISTGIEPTACVSGSSSSSPTASGRNPWSTPCAARSRPAPRR